MTCLAGCDSGSSLVSGGELLQQVIRDSRNNLWAFDMEFATKLPELKAQSVPYKETSGKILKNPVLRASTTCCFIS